MIHGEYYRNGPCNMPLKGSFILSIRGGLFNLRPVPFHLTDDQWRVLVQRTIHDDASGPFNLSLPGDLFNLRLYTVSFDWRFAEKAGVRGPALICGKNRSKEQYHASKYWASERYDTSPLDCLNHRKGPLLLHSENVYEWPLSLLCQKCEYERLIVHSRHCFLVTAYQPAQLCHSPCK